MSIPSTSATAQSATHASENERGELGAESVHWEYRLHFAALRNGLCSWKDRCQILRQSPQCQTALLVHQASIECLGVPFLVGNCRLTARLQLPNRKPTMHFTRA